MTTNAPYNEQELLHQLAAGQEPAFRSLFDHYRNKVYSIASRLLGVEAAAEDVVQEVFIKLWANREKMADISNLNAWINTVTRNHVFNSLRKLANEEQFLSDFINTHQPAGKDTADAVAFKELQNLLGQAVNRLTPQQKKVYNLSRGQGLKLEEIALQLGISKETVKSHIADAVSSVKEYLKKHHGPLLLWLTLLINSRDIHF